MSRSGYIDDGCYDRDEILAQGRWRAQVRSAMNGERGQKLLRDLAAALDAMPRKVLIADSLQDADGDFCTLGVLGAARGIDMSELDPEDTRQVGKAFDVARQMVAEIVYFNDEAGCWMLPFGVKETPEARWKRMRAWVEQHLIKAETAA